MRLRHLRPEKNTSSKMKMLILPIGQADTVISNTIQSGLIRAFPNSICKIVEDLLQIPKEAYNPLRNQYNSSVMLARISDYTARTDADRVLGVTNVDLYVSQMNFIFGEAQCPGKAAIISLHRLRPEFYEQPPNERLFKERAIKEAVHEIGHTLGLGHCQSPFCVMLFSLHIGMTDQKEAKFCERCRLKVEWAVRKF